MPPRQLSTPPWCPEHGTGQATWPLLPSPGSADRASPLAHPRLHQQSPACEMHPHRGAGGPKRDREHWCHVGDWASGTQGCRDRGSGTHLFGHPTAGGAARVHKGLGSCLEHLRTGPWGRIGPVSPPGRWTVTRRGLWAHRMGTCLGWGARPAHPEAGYDLRRTRLIPVMTKPSAVQRTGHTEAIHTAPRLHPALRPGS